MPKAASVLILALVSISPLAWIAYRFFLMGPSANPAQELTHLFGRVGIYALVLNLSIGNFLAVKRVKSLPVSWWPKAMLTLKKFRRPLGVAGWVYLVVHVAFHFINEAGIEEGIDAILHAQYLWFGLAAFTILTALATTSNDYSQRRLGRRWQKLHRFVYVGFFLAVIHTLMIEKADLIHFSILALAAALPFAIRLLYWARAK